MCNAPEQSTVDLLMVVVDHADCDPATADLLSQCRKFPDVDASMYSAFMNGRLVVTCETFEGLLAHESCEFLQFSTFVVPYSPRTSLVLLWVHRGDAITMMIAKYADDSNRHAKFEINALLPQTMMIDLAGLAAAHLLEPDEVSEKNVTPS